MKVFRIGEKMRSFFSLYIENSVDKKRHLRFLRFYNLSTLTNVILDSDDYATEWPFVLCKSALETFGYFLFMTHL